MRLNNCTLFSPLLVCLILFFTPALLVYSLPIVSDQQKDLKIEGRSQDSPHAGFVRAIGNASSGSPHIRKRWDLFGGSECPFPLLYNSQ